jgi:hypothetical protein
VYMCMCAHVCVRARVCAYLHLCARSAALTELRRYGAGLYVRRGSAEAAAYGHAGGPALVPPFVVLGGRRAGGRRAGMFTYARQLLMEMKMTACTTRFVYLGARLRNTPASATLALKNMHKHKQSL